MDSLKSFAAALIFLAAGAAFADCATATSQGIPTTDMRARSSARILIPAPATAPAGTSGTQCSATLVADEAKAQSMKLLTASHCLQAYNSGDSLTVYVQLSGTTYTVPARIAYAGPKDPQDPTVSYSTWTPDIALLTTTMAAPVGAYFSGLDGGAASLPAGTEVTTLGFPGGTTTLDAARGAVGTTAEPSGRVPLTFTSGGESPGSSGSGVFRDADLTVGGVSYGGPAVSAGSCSSSADAFMLSAAWGALGPILAPSGGVVVSGYESTATAPTPTPPPAPAPSGGSGGGGGGPMAPSVVIGLLALAAARKSRPKR